MFTMYFSCIIVLLQLAATEQSKKYGFQLTPFESQAISAEIKGHCVMIAAYGKADLEP